MTCIVGTVTKDGCVILGGDSAGVGGMSLTVRKDPKVFLKDGMAYGFTSSFRMGQLIQYRFDRPDHDPRTDTDTYLRTVWIDKLRRTLEDGGYARKQNGEERGGTFMIGYDGRLFTVEDDYQIGESVHPYYAVGCGDDIAKGAMHALLDAGVDDEKKVLAALAAAERHSAGVRGPFALVKLPVATTNDKGTNQ